MNRISRCSAIYGSRPNPCPCVRGRLIHRRYGDDLGVLWLYPGPCGALTDNPWGARRDVGVDSSCPGGSCNVSCQGGLQVTEGLCQSGVWWRVCGTRSMVLMAGRCELQLASAPTVRMPFGQCAARLFFQLVSSRCEHASWILTSNVPFARCGDVFGDLTISPAGIDRSVHQTDLISLKAGSFKVQKYQTIDITAQGQNTTGCPVCVPMRRCRCLIGLLPGDCGGWQEPGRLASSTCSVSPHVLLRHSRCRRTIREPVLTSIRINSTTPT